MHGVWSQSSDNDHEEGNNNEEEQERHEGRKRRRISRSADRLKQFITHPER